MNQPRARRVITRGPMRVVGKFPSLKSGRSLHWESQLERDRMYALEFDSDVLSFREQPRTYDLSVEGKPCRYTPDLEVVRSDRTVIEEVKPSDRVEEYAALFAAAECRLAHDDLFFSVVTETDIRSEPRLSNIKLLLRYRRFNPEEPVLLETVRLVADMVPASLGKLAEACRRHGLPDWMPWWLLSHHRLATDLDVPLTTESLLQS